MYVTIFESQVGNRREDPASDHLAGSSRTTAPPDELRAIARGEMQMHTRMARQEGGDLLNLVGREVVEDD
jgi:hypothetical protein